MTCAFEYLIFAPGTWTRNNLLELVLGAGGLHGAVRHHLCEHPPPSDFSSKLGSGWEGYDRDRRRGPPTRSGEHNGVWERECEEDPGACDSMHAPCSRAAPRREGACMGRAVGLRNDRGQGNAWQRLPWSPAQRYPSRRARPLPPPGGTPGRQDTRSGSMQHSEPPQDLVAVDVDVASAPARGVRHGAGVAAEDAGDGAGVGGLLLVKAGELRQGRARCRVSGAWGDGHWHRFGGGVCPARWGACAAQAAPRATEAVRTEAGALLARRAAPHVHAPARPHAAETHHFLCFAKRQQARKGARDSSRGTETMP